MLYVVDLIDVLRERIAETDLNRITLLVGTPRSGKIGAFLAGIHPNAFRCWEAVEKQSSETESGKMGKKETLADKTMATGPTLDSRPSCGSPPTNSATTWMRRSTSTSSWA